MIESCLDSSLHSQPCSLSPVLKKLTVECIRQGMAWSNICHDTGTTQSRKSGSRKGPSLEPSLLMPACLFSHIWAFWYRLSYAGFVVFSSFLSLLLISPWDSYALSIIIHWRKWWQWQFAYPFQGIGLSWLQMLFSIKSLNEMMNFWLLKELHWVIAQLARLGRYELFISPVW